MLLIDHRVSVSDYIPSHKLQAHETKQNLSLLPFSEFPDPTFPDRQTPGSDNHPLYAGFPLTAPSL